MKKNLNGLKRINRVLNGEVVDRPAVLPICHSALPPLFDVMPGDYFTDAEEMADVIVRGYRTFGYDGVQLSSGVTAEAEGLGAYVEKPRNSAPVLKENLLSGKKDLSLLSTGEITSKGSLSIFFDAVSNVVREIGNEAFVLATLRGPLLIGSQLCGVKEILMDMLEDPGYVEEVLDFSVDVALILGRWLLESGAHGVLLGEAVCSPNFISPDLYREVVHSRHVRLVKGLKQMGWKAVGLHICGNILPIFNEIIGTGVDFMDVDYQVPVERALKAAGINKNKVGSSRNITLRGNLDPATVFRYGDREKIESETKKLCDSVRNRQWIISSGCDIPPGTPKANLVTFMETALQ